MNEKAKAFYKWLNDCPFKIWKIQYDSHGQTTVSFIWDDDAEISERINKQFF